MALYTPAMVKKYKINEIFYSLQGEGYHTGVPMIFVRFSECNLSCPFCDTNHQPFRWMSADEIRQEIGAWKCKRVCLTGGEPTLQVTDQLIEEAFEGYTVHMETNGTLPVASKVDWITLSPKHGKVVLERCNELKLLYGPGMDSPTRWESFPAEHHFLQPMSIEGNPQATDANTQDTIDYILEHPGWRLSLQTHKITNIR